MIPQMDTRYASGGEPTEIVLDGDDRPEPRNRAERRGRDAQDRSFARAVLRRARHRNGKVPAFPMRSAFKGIHPRPMGSVA